MYGKIVCVLVDNGKPIKLFFEKKGGGTIERDLADIADVYKKPSNDACFEINKLT